MGVGLRVVFRDSHSQVLQRQDELKKVAGLSAAAARTPNFSPSPCLANFSCYEVEDSTRTPCTPDPRSLLLPGTPERDIQYCFLKLCVRSFTRSSARLPIAAKVAPIDASSSGLVCKQPSEGVPTGLVSAPGGPGAREV